VEIFPRAALAEMRQKMTKYLDYGLEGRVAIVTGGGTGIGASTAVELAKGGAKVIIFGRREGPIEETKAECLKYTDSVNALSVDVSDKAQVDKAVAGTIDTFGKIDILVNNAGVEGPLEPGKTYFEDYFDTYTPEEYERFFRINTMGHYLMNIAVLPNMIEHGYGRVVNVTSVLAIDGSYDTPAYVASKGGATTQSKAFARRYGRHGITFNAILPGFVETPMKADAGENERVWVRDITPLGRVAEPIDVARAILFFTQEHLFVSGQTLVVSGGANIF
jgi:NAD(P)-dependent dehydrogenase (short-subunit alcohol dehydrogenase family)